MLHRFKLKIKVIGSCYKYDFSPDCRIEDVSDAAGNEIDHAYILITSKFGNLGPGESSPYKCAVSANDRRIAKAKIVVWGTYDLNIIPVIWKKHCRFASEPFQWAFDSSGQPHWIEGEQLDELR